MTIRGNLEDFDAVQLQSDLADEFPDAVAVELAIDRKDPEREATCRLLSDMADAPTAARRGRGCAGLLTRTEIAAGFELLLARVHDLAVDNPSAPALLASFLVRAIADHLPPGGWLWMQSDVEDLALDMREVTRATEPIRLRDAREAMSDWGVEKPDGLLGVQTERERASEELGRAVYRCLFVATGEAGDSSE